jgi:hypothetical protein
MTRRRTPGGGRERIWVQSSITDLKHKYHKEIGGMWGWSAATGWIRVAKLDIRKYKMIEIYTPAFPDGILLTRTEIWEYSIRRASEKQLEFLLKFNL